MLSNCVNKITPMLMID